MENRVRLVTSSHLDLMEPTTSSVTPQSVVRGSYDFCDELEGECPPRREQESTLKPLSRPHLLALQVFLRCTTSFQPQRLLHHDHASESCP